MSGTKYGPQVIKVLLIPDMAIFSSCRVVLPDPPELKLALRSEVRLLVCLA
jgi:hypothetical protein